MQQGVLFIGGKGLTPSAALPLSWSLLPAWPREALGPPAVCPGRRPLAGAFPAAEPGEWQAEAQGYAMCRMGKALQPASPAFIPARQEDGWRALWGGDMT